MSSKSDPKPAESPSPIGEISQEPSALDSFLDANQKKLIVIGILAILVLVGYVVYDGLKEMKIRDEAGIVGDAKTVTELEKAIQEVDSPNAKGSALLRKSQLLWNDQQQQEAIATLEDFIKNYPEHPAIGSAYASLGSYQQQLENLTEAKEALQKSVETKSATSSLSLLTLGDLAREAGDNDEARAYYERIITEYEESHFQVKAFARERIELIGVESPSEKAPEPPKPNPGIPDLNPGAVTPSVGIPGVSPIPMPRPKPAEGSTDEPDTTAPATGEPTEDAPVENTDSPDKPAQNDAPAGGQPDPTPDTPGEPAAAEEPAGEATENGPDAPESDPTGPDETSPAE